MDRTKVKKENGKVFSLNEVKLLKKDYLSLDYEIKLYPYKEITDTGLLIIGRLASLKKELALFFFRWDEKKEALDVEIDNVDNHIKKKFKTGKNGYKGHHSVRIQSGEGRIFRLDVSLPDKKIFQGEIKVPVFRKLELGITVHSEVEVDDA